MSVIWRIKLEYGGNKAEIFNKRQQNVYPFRAFVKNLEGLSTSEKCQCIDN